MKIIEKLEYFLNLKQSQNTQLKDASEKDKLCIIYDLEEYRKNKVKANLKFLIATVPTSQVDATIKLILKYTPLKKPQINVLKLNDERVEIYVNR